MVNDPQVKLPPPNSFGSTPLLKSSNRRAPVSIERTCTLPVLPPLVTVIVSVPVPLTDTDSVRTPVSKLPVIAGLQPERLAVDVNDRKMPLSSLKA